MSLKNLLVFVYGTLKRGQPNHFWMTEPNNGYAKYLGDGKTVQPYPLVIATRYNIPFLLPVPGVGYTVSGEVFEVDEKMLSRLDVLEEHPNYYERLMEPIKLDSNANLVECWTYFLKDFKKELLDAKMYPDYDSKGDRGLKFWDKTERDSNYDYKSPVQITK